MFSQEVTLLHEIMAAYPHRNPNCNKLDEFIAKMEGFRKRYQQIIDVMPPDKAAELIAGFDVRVAKQAEAFKQLAEEEQIALEKEASDLLVKGDPMAIAALTYAVTKGNQVGKLIERIEQPVVATEECKEVERQIIGMLMEGNPIATAAFTGKDLERDTNGKFVITTKGPVVEAQGESGDVPGGAE